jgi:tetratricopeptide (TPR) repeat protein
MRAPASSEQSMILEAIQPLVEIGMNTSDMAQAESCLCQVCGLLRSMLENAAASKHPQNNDLSESSLLQLYLRARLRLGQIAAWNGHLAEAYELFGEIVRSAQSGVTLQAVAWHDLGVLFLASDQPDHALQAFQQAVTAPSDEHRRQGFCGMDADHVTRRFLPGALRQLETVMDCLEQRRALSPEDCFYWSIELMFPEEDLKISSSPRRSITQTEVGTGAAAGAA